MTAGTSAARPAVGVVVLNYNGGALTERCIESLHRAPGPPLASVVLVDNASSDGVAESVVAAFPNVDVVRSDVNLGFAGGCNLGIRRLKDVDYVALVNNDAIVDEGWLEPLVAALEADPGVGAANSKVLFDRRFVDVRLTCADDVPGRGDRRPLGVRVCGARVDGDNCWPSIQFVDGFWGPEYDGDETRPFQWSSSDALLRVPSPGGGPFSLRLSARREKTVTVMVGGRAETVAVSRAPRWHEFVSDDLGADVINSVGVEATADAYGVDRGFLEVDRGQYDGEAEVFAWTGSSVLLSRRYLDEVGLFDERFFLYYEDFDLSWRGRLRGWRYVCAPASTVRHVHAASSGLGSRFLSYHVERNRLLSLLRCAPAPVVVRALYRFIGVTMSYARRDIVARMARGERPSAEHVRRRLRALAGFLRLFIPTLRSRWTVRRRRRIPDADVVRWFEA